MALIEKNPEPNKTKRNLGFSTPSVSDLGLSPQFEGRYWAALSAYDPESVKDTFADKLANGFGFRSSADKMRYQLNQSRQEALAQLVNQQAEQEYNSESAKASRMREAGLNPDLIGLSDASEATEGTEPQTSPDFSGLSTLSDFASGFIDSFKSALSLVSGIQGLKLNGINISDKVLDLGSKVRGKTIDILRDTLSKDELSEFFDAKNFQGTKFHWSDETLKSYGLRSPRERKMFLDIAENLRKSYSGKMADYDSLEAYLNAQESAMTAKGKWFREQGDSDIQVFTALRGFAMTLHNLEKIDAEYRSTLAEYNKSVTNQLNPADAADALNAENQYKGDYYHSLSGEAIAGAENADARLKSIEDSYRQKVTEEMDRYFDSLIKSTDPMSILLYIQMMTNTNLFGNLHSLVGTSIISAGAGKIGLKRGAQQVEDFFTKRGWFSEN